MPSLLDLFFSALIPNKDNVMYVALWVISDSRRLKESLQAQFLLDWLVKKTRKALKSVLFILIIFWGPFLQSLLRLRFHSRWK